MSNIIECATDGAPATVGRQRGFISFMKRADPELFVIHRVVHREHLVAKHLSVRLHDSLNIVITVVNKIKSSALNDRIFRQLCHENETEFERLLFQTEVRWLSKANCLSRFYSLFDTIVEFLEKSNPQLINDVQKAKIDVAHLSEIFDKFNAMNLQLQGSVVTLIKFKTVICSFFGREFYQFSRLAELAVSDDDLLAYCDHLDELKMDMTKRFTDLLELEIPDWIIDPFCVHVETVSLSFQEELIDLQNDCEEKARFKMMGKEQFWQAFSKRSQYAALWKRAKLITLSFPASYLVEKGISCSSIVNQTEK